MILWTVRIWSAIDISFFFGICANFSWEHVSFLYVAQYAPLHKNISYVCELTIENKQHHPYPTHHPLAASVNTFFRRETLLAQFCHLHYLCLCLSATFIFKVQCTFLSLLWNYCIAFLFEERGWSAFAAASPDYYSNPRALHSRTDPAIFLSFLQGKPCQRDFLVLPIWNFPL